MANLNFVFVFFALTSEMKEDVCNATAFFGMEKLNFFLSARQEADGVVKNLLPPILVCTKFKKYQCTISIEAQESYQPQELIPKLLRFLVP